MTGQIAGGRFVSLVRLTVAIAVSLAAGSPASADQAPRAIRTQEPEIVDLIALGSQRSATFRRLLAGVDRSGWLVMVLSGPCPGNRVRGCLLHDVVEINEQPSLLVRLQSEGRSPHAVLRTLAHELQHVIEVTDHIDATRRDVRAVFERIGTKRTERRGVTTYETRAARDVGLRVLRELERARR